MSNKKPVTTMWYLRLFHHIIYREGVNFFSLLLLFSNKNFNSIFNSIFTNNYNNKFNSIFNSLTHKIDPLLLSSSVKLQQVPFSSNTILYKERP